MLNIGLVGCGDISGIYIDNIRDKFADALRLAAVCDLIPERAEKAKEAYGNAKIYATMDELFADPDIDIVLNLTRPYQHFGVSSSALKAGKHVYSEKPLGASLEEGRELVALAEEKGLWLGGAPDTFLGAGIQTCRKLLDSGEVGKVVGGRCAVLSKGPERWHHDPDFFYQYGGGPLFDMGPYYVTALINLIGGVKEVTGVSTMPFSERMITAKEHYGEMIKVNVDTHIESILTFDTGVSVSLAASFDVYKTKQPNITLYTTKGTLYVPDPNNFGGTIEFFDGASKETNEYPLEFPYNVNSRALGLADMAKAIECGTPARTTYRQTFHVLEVLATILKSSDEGRTLPITSRFEREAPMPEL